MSSNSRARRRLTTHVGHHWLRGGIAAAWLLLLAPQCLGEEDGTLNPTPFKTPTEAIAHAKRVTLGKKPHTLPPEDIDVAGAITKLEDGRLGFMPLLQHHMAVEHWFVSGMDTEALKKVVAKEGSRCFVRVRGTCTLVGSYGSSFLQWYGNGLPHRKTHGPTMGYHERVYTLAVKEVVWVRDRAALTAARADLKARQEAIRAALAAGHYVKGETLLSKAVALCPDAGVDPKGLIAMREHAVRMVMLLSDPNTWGEAETQNAILCLTGQPTVPFRELRKESTNKLLSLIASWPESLRHGLAPRAIKAWEALQYKHQRNASLRIVSALGGAAIDDWNARRREAKQRVAAAIKELPLLAARGDYAGMLKLLEDTEPYQEIDRSYALAKGRVQYWVPAAKRLNALKSLLGDTQARLSAILKTMDETISEASGLPNSDVQPRFNHELIERFFPQLTSQELAACEAALIARGKGLDGTKEWKRVLLVTELLSGCGAENAMAFFEAIKHKVKTRPLWQRKFIEAFAGRVRAKVKAVETRRAVR